MTWKVSEELYKTRDAILSASKEATKYSEALVKLTSVLVFVTAIYTIATIIMAVRMFLA